MSTVMNKMIVLKLNRNWQVIDQCTVQKAITALCGGENGEHPAMVMDFAPTINEDGTYDFDQLDYVNPVPWEQWEKLPIRDFDMVIDTARGPIRCPTIIISANYAEMPMNAPKFSKRAVWERDKGICAYTGKQVDFESGNIDHVIPRDLGGKDTFENTVVSCKEVNSMKGNRLNEQVGLKLQRVPKAPPMIPASATITEAKHPSWNQFLIKRRK